MNEAVKSIDLAIEHEEIGRVRNLITKNADLVVTYSRRWLGLAVSLNNKEMLELLLDLGCDINAVERLGSGIITVLDRAIHGENPAMVRYLLERGANPDPDRQVIAAARHSLEILKLLEQYGADLHKVFINEHTDEPMNALSTAIDWGKDDVAEYLRSKGAVMPESKGDQRKPETLSDEIVAYFTEHIGPVRRQSLIEIVPTEPPIAVHVIPPTDETNCVTLFTTGMSARPLTVPQGEEEFQYAELFIQLPRDWKYMEVNNPNFGWPIHWLRSLAKYPHENQTWLGGPASIVTNEDPPEQLAPNTDLSCLLLMAEKQFTSSGGKLIRLYRLVPLYSQECDLEKKEGVGALMRALDRKSVPFVVDLDRLSVAAS